MHRENPLQDKNDPEYTEVVLNQSPRSGWVNFLRLIACILLIGAGIGGFIYLNKTAQKSKKRQPAPFAPIVEVQIVEKKDVPVRINAMGTVVPAREVALKTALKGEIVFVHPQFAQGGMIPADTEIVRINPKDYELEVEQRRKAVADAEYALEIEQGRQDIAKREWELLYSKEQQNSFKNSLALRKPHLEKANSDLSAAKAQLEQAELDLSRTSISLPYNILIRQTYVNLGSQVSANERLADCIGVDTYWVEASLPVDKLQWLQFAGNDNSGSVVEIFYRDQQIQHGRLLRVLPDLSKEGRMARVLVEISDPLGFKQKKLIKDPPLIGEFVKLTIEGPVLNNVFQLPRTAFHDDSTLWIAGPENKLEIRVVEAVWRDEKNVYFSDDLAENERLVVSSLATPVAGMPLTIYDNQSDAVGQNIPAGGDTLTN